MTQQPPTIKSNLVWAILVTVLCFLPTGICAIAYAAKADSLAMRGNIDEAREKTAKSRMWRIASICIAIFIFPFIFSHGPFLFLPLFILMPFLSISLILGICISYTI